MSVTRFASSLKHAANPHPQDQKEPNANLICMLLANLSKSPKITDLLTLKRDVPKPLSTSPIAPWHQTYRPSVSTDQARSNAVQTPSAAAMNSRTRAMSQVSLSGSFTYQPPTSPLVHQANAADISDYDWLGFGDIGTGQGRRHASSPWLARFAWYQSHCSQQVAEGIIQESKFISSLFVIRVENHFWSKD